MAAGDHDRSVAGAEQELSDQRDIVAAFGQRPVAEADRLRAARTAAEARREAVRTLLDLTDAVARSVGDRSVVAAEVARQQELAAAETGAVAAAESRLAPTQAALAEAALHRPSLDPLLGHANAQPADLARRDRLERAAGGGPEIQAADRDMGDEARSVHSLSVG